MSSAGLSGSQFLSFFPHIGPSFIGLDLFGSDVLNHLVMEALGVLPRFVREPQNGVEGDTAEATGGAHPVALDQVMRDIQSLLVRLSEQCSFFSYGRVWPAASCVAGVVS